MKGIFREAGAKAEVDIISDVTDDNGMRVVELICTNVIRNSPMFGVMPVGPFTVTVLANQEHNVGWSLSIIKEENISDNKPCTYDGIFKGISQC